MNTKLKTLLQQLLRSPRSFPVEAALGVVFFIIAVLDLESSSWDEVSAHMKSCVNGDILWLFAPLMVLTFWLQRVNRWAYLASFFLFIPLMALNLKPFLWTYGFAFTYVLAAILLVVGNRKMDNRSFASHALHVVTQMAFGLLISGILNLVVIAIVACILSFAAGYYYRGNMPQTADVAAVVADSLPAVATDTLANDSLAADNVKNDTTVVEQTKEDAVAETTETVKEETKTESAKEVSAQPEAATDKYEQMDVRVRTGAYRILGEDHEVKVKAGETLAKLARRTLGADMECYIEVFNGLKPNTSLTEGQTIKIPKLELKKKKKANN